MLNSLNIVVNPNIPANEVLLVWKSPEEDITEAAKSGRVVLLKNLRLDNNDLG